MKRTIAGVVLAAAMATDAPAQEARATVPRSVLEAQELLVAAYPELREGRMAWRVEPTTSGVAVEAAPARLSFDAPPPLALVAATLLADEEGRVQELRVAGALIDAARAKLVGRSSSAPTNARAKFPPDDPDALESLVPAGLQARLGAPTVRERTFRTEGSEDEAQTWRVEVESPDVVPVRYTLVFEPFEGRLLSVVRR
jgi:hypothetical protein